MESKRLFIGVNLVDRFDFNSLIYILKKELAWCDIKWVNPFNIHLTIKFIGDTKLFEKITNQLNFIKKSSFDINFDGLSYFSRDSLPSTVHIETLISDNCLKLYTEIENKLLPLGLDKDSRCFKPHITLGRVKQCSDVKRFKDAIAKIDQTIEKLKINICDFILFESILKPQGPEYRVLQKYNLES
ncbi:MAG: RNA 2',3'-cyclic phosphodiesterase [Candidatus Delongbacteria bacterium]|nr:RNA 2',3'-cyclic phosphodiesterase [Candidatus Delongbacteria bacterium]MBN2833413.1 RNA 2',3'-cyclic phosphodiesterase [Candidatus Delongbacteria bacterium]